MPNQTSSINLLKKQEVNFFEKFISWALTIGRIIVIITEIVALSAFIYRFSLDRKLIDLHSKIKQEQTIVGLSKANEEKYRNLQDRLALAAKYDENGKQTVQIFKDVLKLAPQDFIFDTVIVSEKNIRIEAHVQSVLSLTTFVNQLRNYPKTETVSIDKIENKTSNATIVVVMTALIKNK